MAKLNLILNDDYTSTKLLVDPTTKVKLSPDQPVSVAGTCIDGIASDSSIVNQTALAGGPVPPRCDLTTPTLFRVKLSTKLNNQYFQNDGTGKPVEASMCFYRATDPAVCLPNLIALKYPDPTQPFILNGAIKLPLAANGKDVEAGLMYRIQFMGATTVGGNPVPALYDPKVTNKPGGLSLHERWYHEHYGLIAFAAENPVALPLALAAGVVVLLAAGWFGHRAWLGRG